MDLKKYKLGDIADIINGATPSTSCEDNYDGEIVWITPKDLSEQKAKYVNEVVGILHKRALIVVLLK